MQKRAVETVVFPSKEGERKRRKGHLLFPLAGEILEGIMDASGEEKEGWGFPFGGRREWCLAFWSASHIVVKRTICQS